MTPGPALPSTRPLSAHRQPRHLTSQNVLKHLVTLHSCGHSITIATNPESPSHTPVPQHPAGLLPIPSRPLTPPQTQLSPPPPPLHPSVNRAWARGTEPHPAPSATSCCRAYPLLSPGSHGRRRPAPGRLMLSALPLLHYVPAAPGLSPLQPADASAWPSCPPGLSWGVAKGLGTRRRAPSGGSARRLVPHRDPLTQPLSFHNNGAFFGRKPSQTGRK